VGRGRPEPLVSCQAWFIARYALKQAKLQSSAQPIQSACTERSRSEVEVKPKQTGTGYEAIRSDKQAHHCDVQNPSGDGMTEMVDPAVME
jgi:hypothetical protein